MFRPRTFLAVLLLCGFLVIFSSINWKHGIPSQPMRIPEPPPQDFFIETQTLTTTTSPPPTTKTAPTSPTTNATTTSAQGTTTSAFNSAKYPGRIDNVLQFAQGKLFRRGYRRAAKRVFYRGFRYLREPVILTQTYTDICGFQLLNRSVTVCAQQLLQIAKEVGQQVPPLVHYTLLFTGKDIAFHAMVSMLSSLHILKPRYVILWHMEPQINWNGIYWQHLLKNISANPETAQKVITMRLKPVEQVYGHKMHYREHPGDVLRLELLYVFGGLYIDMDVLVVKPFTPLYHYPVTIGQEDDFGVNGAAMLAQPGALFLRFWHLFFRVYDIDDGWSTFACMLPHVLAWQWPELVHVERYSMMYPNYRQGEILYDRPRVWDWRSRNYCVHLWIRFLGRQLNFETVKKEDSMHGDLCRFILYGM